MIWTKIFNPINIDCLDSDKQKLLANSLYDSIQRAMSLSYLFSVVFFVYGFLSFDYIKRFDATVTLVDNLWPRFVFNTVPLLILISYLKKTKKSNSKKLLIWTVVFSMIIDIAACTYVWPICLSGKGEILAYVNSANIYLFALIYIVIAPPSIYLIYFTLILCTLFVFPLFIVAYLSRDFVVFKLILNDSLVTIFSGIILSIMIQNLRTKVAILELERSHNVSKFIGPTVYKALYEDRKDLLKTRKNEGFVLNMDIRGYSLLFQNNPEKLAALFMEKYAETVGNTVSRYGGYIHRSIGDGHLISFGLMDEPIDLSDIDDIADEVKKAEIRRKQNYFSNAISCYKEIVNKGVELSLETNIKGIFKLGAGLDLGEIEIKITGDKEHHMELDLFGESLIRAARLQEYTKIIADQFSQTTSLLVVSETAAQYNNNQEALITLKTTPHKVRNFSNLDQVFVKNIDILSQLELEKKAA